MAAAASKHNKAFFHTTAATHSSATSNANTATTANANWRRRIAALTLTAGIGMGVNALTSSSDSSSSSPISLTTMSCAAPTRSDWPPPLLTSAAIYQALASPVEQIHAVQRGIIKEYHVNQYAANPHIEDTFAVSPSVSCPPGGFLLGVFDGHSGRDASRWCAEELLPYLQYYRWSNRTDALIHKRTFIEADHHFLECSIRDKRMLAGMSGACLNVAHIKHNVIRTANAGDCRTIVGKRVKRVNPPAISTNDKISDEYKYQAVELTSDHQIDTNHLERERLLREHPDEHDIIHKNRVKGRLQPTRGFGDGFYKRKEFFQSRSLSKPYATWTPPYTTVEPDVTQYEVQAEDEFLVMASDGLFQDLNSQQVVEYVGEWLQLQRAEAARAAKTSFLGFGASAHPAPNYCKNASSFLIKQALTHASEHAVGRRKKENENLSWIMQLPLEHKRNYHDDITVAVVFFDHHNQYPADAAVVTPAGPPVPQTLSRALSLHIKAPAISGPSQLPSNDGTVPIRVAPLPNQDTGAAPIRSNL